jgi:hypothetical protein
MAMVMPAPAVGLVEKPYTDLIVAGLRPVGEEVAFGRKIKAWQRADPSEAGPGQTGLPWFVFPAAMAEMGEPSIMAVIITLKAIRENLIISPYRLTVSR